MNRWSGALVVVVMLLGLAACSGDEPEETSKSSEPDDASTQPVELEATDAAGDGGKADITEVGFTVLDSYDGVVDVLAAAEVTNTSEDSWLHQADIRFVFTDGDAEQTVADNKLADLAPGESTVLGRLMTVDFKPEKLEPVAADAAWYAKADVDEIGTDLRVDVTSQKIDPGDDAVRVEAEYETFDDRNLLSRLYAGVAVRDADGALLGAAQLDTGLSVSEAGDHDGSWDFNDYEWPEAATAEKSDVVLRCVACLP